MLWLPLLRRGTGALALAAVFLACDEERSLAPPDTSPDPAPIVFAGHAGPVWPGDFPDPYILATDSGYYAYATNLAVANVPVLRSSDLTRWTTAGDALPVLPAWAEPGKRLTWAPAVLAVGSRYVLFFTARDRSSGRQCIGRAESSHPAGPFLDRSSSPFLCQPELGGSIDPSVARDEADGGLYLIWKNDGNCCNGAVSLWSQRLDSRAARVLGPRAALLTRDRAWEGPLIEGPTMWREQGVWHLLYSANMWNTDRYAIGYARCDSPLGPCRKRGIGPVMRSDRNTVGPGGPEVFTDRAGRRHVAYHGWRSEAVGYRRGGARSLRIDRIEVEVANPGSAVIADLAPGPPFRYHPEGAMGAP
jgi:hypothetical protein